MEDSLSTSVVLSTLRADERLGNPPQR